MLATLTWAPRSMVQTEAARTKGSQGMEEEHPYIITQVVPVLCQRLMWEFTVRLLARKITRVDLVHTFLPREPAQEGKS